MKKASKLHSYWIIIQSAYDILHVSLKTLFRVFFTDVSREKISEYGKQLGKRLLKRVKLSYEMFDPYHLAYQPGRCHIIMSNHLSHYDIPLSLGTLPGNIRMITKSELFRVPIWGRAMKASEFIPMDRKNKEQAKKDLANAKAKMEDGIVVWIAPEGTRSRTGKMGEFKKGGFMLAFQTDAIIIPVGIRGTYNVLPPETTQFSLGEHAEIHIGKPIDTQNYQFRERKKLMQDVENAIREAAGEAL